MLGPRPAAVRTCTVLVIFSISASPPARAEGLLAERRRVVPLDRRSRYRPVRS